MAKKKKVVPLFSLKTDFIDSLENFCQRAIILHQAVDIALSQGQINGAVKDIIKQRLDEFRDAMMSNGDE